MLNDNTVPNGSSNNHQQPQQQAINILNHIHSIGFSNAQFSDLCLNIYFDNNASDTIALQYQLHKLILSQSLLFQRYFHQQSNIQEITIKIPSPIITHETIAFILGYLYSPYASPIPDNETLLFPLLLTSLHFGLPQLSTDISNQIIQSNQITVTTIRKYVEFIGIDDSTPELQFLRGFLFEYLTRGVFEEVLGDGRVGEDFNNERGEKYDFVVSVFAGLPFEWIKGCVESKRSILDDKGVVRYKFAKSIITYRQTLGHVDETVLATFGGEAGSRKVNIVRKARNGGGDSKDGLVKSFSPTGNNNFGDGRRVWKFHDDY